MSKTGTTIRYEYNHEGLRTQKFVDTNNKTDATYYTYNGKSIIHVIKNSDHLHIFYDAQNRVAKVSHNGVFYTYIYNLQGDIVGLVDKDGALVVEYKYDAWGKPISTTGTLAATLGKLNPFRYRGYVYDEETGLYYLGSRYYAPILGRFLNADGYVATSEDLLACNMYAYCFNSPIAHSDPEGTDCICLHQRVHGNHVCYSEKDASSANISPKTVLYKTHRTNKTPSNRVKHEGGESRRQRDHRGEKGDARRKQDRSNKHKIETIGASILLLGVIVYVVANDVTGVGAADDASLVPLGAMLWDHLSLLFS